MYVNKKNILRTILPEGTIVSRQWLELFQFNRHSIDNSIKSGQLQSVAKGIYTKNPALLRWQGIVFSLQNYFNSDIVPGGLTALELQGYAHYLPMSHEVQIHLYTSKPPSSWLNNVVPDVRFVTHRNTELLGRAGKASDEEILKPYTTTYTWREELRPIKISSPERAILEVLSGVPKYISFEHAEQLMQGMTALSPATLQELLEKCENIKVRRLFFWMADRLKYSWLQKLDRDKISLGSGNRMLVKGGRLDKKYKITVPGTI